MLGKSTGLIHAMLNAAFNGVGVNLFDSGILEGRTGSRPASANDAPVGTVVFAATLPADAFANAAALAVAITAAFSDASADASGIPTWFRIRQSGDLGTTNTTDERIDGDVVESPASGDFEMDNTDINLGQTIEISGGSLSMTA